jgi:hypothetical protein
MPSAHHRIPLARRRTALPLPSLPNVRPAHCIPNGSADQGTAKAIPEPPARPRPLLQPTHRGSCTVRIGTSRPEARTVSRNEAEVLPVSWPGSGRVRPPSAESERSEGCPVEETQRRETVKGISGLRRELSRTAGPVHARLWWISAHRLPVYASPGPLPDQTQDSVPATRWLAGSPVGLSALLSESKSPTGTHRLRPAHAMARSILQGATARRLSRLPGGP